MIDVVVPYFDAPDRLTSILQALNVQRDGGGRPLDLTVIVADDASKFAPEVSSSSHPVRVVRQRRPGYRASATRNLGARSGNGEIIIFVDGDTVPTADYVNRLVEPIAAGRAGLTTGRRRHADFAGLSPDQVVSFVSAPEPARLLAEPSWLADGLVRTDLLRDGSSRSYEYVISAVLAVRRSSFDLVDGFDERFDSYGGEDWEFAYRCWNAGVGFEHVPSAVAFHDGPDVEGRPDDPDGETAKTIESLRIADLVPASPTRRPGVRYRVPDLDVTLDVCEAALREAAVSLTSVLGSDPGDLVVRLLGSDDTVGRLRALVSDQRVRSESDQPRSVGSRCIVTVTGAVEFGRMSLSRICDDVADGRVAHRKIELSGATIVAESVRLHHRADGVRAGDQLHPSVAGVRRVDERGFAAWSRAKPKPHE